MAGTSNRVVIITGANSGIGYRAAEMLAEKGGYDIILACRSEQKAIESVDSIKKLCPSACVCYHVLDLGDKNSINEFADWFLAEYSRLDVLVNNAGVAKFESPKETTKDGFEVTFGTNHLGHFLLTMRLLEQIKETAKKYGEARIVNVSSGWHNAEMLSKATNWDIRPLDMSDLNLKKPGAYNGNQAYKNSKAANILFTKALTRSLEGTGVVSNSLSPGYIPSTNVFRQAGDTLKDIKFPKARDLTGGAQHIVDMVIGEKYGKTSGIFYRDFEEQETSEEVKNVKLQNALWLKSCEMLGVDYQQVLKQ